MNKDVYFEAKEDDGLIWIKISTGSAVIDMGISLEDAKDWREQLDAEIKILEEAGK